MTRPTLRRVLVAAGAAVVVVGAAAVAVSARSADSPTYRTATVGRHGVDQVLETVGVIEPVSQASVAFPVAGTVASVPVAVGDRVEVGDHLGSLDTEALEDSVHQAQATLDQAEVNLELALDGQLPASTQQGGAGGGGFGRSAGGAGASAIAAAQRDVLEAQQAVDAALADAEAALASARTVCAAGSTTSSTSSGDTSTSVDATTTTTTTTTPPVTDACAQAIDDAIAAQQAVGEAQQELAVAMANLTKLLEQAAAGGQPGTTTTTRPSSGAGAGSTGGAPSTSTPSGGASGTSGGGTGSGGAAATASPSAADLVAYQKQVDAAAQALAVAEQALAQATIVSPIDGTVVSVGFAAGDEVTAGSSTQAVVVAGRGGFEVTTSVPVTDLPDLEVGQAAVVVPDGGHRRIAGEVVRIGVSGTSSGSTVTYPVTIALTGDTSSLGNGATASVTITTKATRKAVAVPTSAVSTNGQRSTVERLVDGKATRTRVEVGAVGRQWTEVTSGVSVGDVVVLADLSEPLPGSATSSSNGNRRQGTSGFPGGGFPGGGPTGGSFPGGGFPGGGPGGG